MASSLNGHEFEQTLEDSEGQGSLACCSPGERKELDVTERLNSNNKGPTSGRTGLEPQTFDSCSMPFVLLHLLPLSTMDFRFLLKGSLLNLSHDLTLILSLGFFFPHLLFAMLLHFSGRSKSMWSEEIFNSLSSYPEHDLLK